MRKMIFSAMTAGVLLLGSACDSSSVTGPSMSERRGVVKAMEYDKPTYKSCKPREVGCRSGKKVKEREEWELTILSDDTGENVEVDVDKQTYDACSIGLYFDGEKCKEQ